LNIVNIGGQVWCKDNLNIDSFINGDALTEIKSFEEWYFALENRIPAFCYYDFNPEFGNEFSKIYNWYALADERGLAPDGYKIPSNSDWIKLVEAIGGVNNGFKIAKIEDEPSSNELGFSALPGGYLDAADEGGFYSMYDLAIFWTLHDDVAYIGRSKYPTFEQEPTPFYMSFESDPIKIRRGSHSESSFINCGYYVRCLKQD